MRSEIRRWLYAKGLTGTIAVALLAAGYSCQAPWWTASAGIAFLAAATRERTALAVAGVGLLIGTLASAIALYWLPMGLARASGCPPLVAGLLTFVASTAYGVRFSIAAWAEHRLTTNGWPPGLGLVLGFTTGELLARGPLPWYLGTCGHDALLLVQVADLVGPVGVSAVLVALGVAVHEALQSSITKKGSIRRRCVIAAVCWTTFVAMATAYGCWKVWGPGAPPGVIPLPTRVGIVQANVPPESTRGDERAGIAAVQRHVVATWDLADRGADIVVWPETAVPIAVPFAEAASLYPRLFTSDLGSPVLLGAALSAVDPTEFYNAALSIDGRGNVLGIYIKRRLAPFSEDVPGGRRIRGLTELFPEAREVAGPEHGEVLTMLGHKVAVLICFESLFPDLVRESTVRDRPELLVSLANDSWFGDTWEPSMHLASVKLRAIEHRRYLVRAATSGVSAIVDPWGRVRTASAASSSASLLDSISFRLTSTPYERFGEGLWWVLAAGLAGLSAVPRARVRPRASWP